MELGVMRLTAVMTPAPPPPQGQLAERVTDRAARLRGPGESGGPKRDRNAYGRYF